MSFTQFSYTRSRSSAFENKITYTVNDSGSIKFYCKTIPHGPMPQYLPKMGFRLLLPNDYHQVNWYGRGPFETYPDRKTGAKIGLYSNTIDNEYVPYLMPQEHGNKTDVEWVMPFNLEMALLIGSETSFNYSIHRYSTENMTRAVYPFQLKKAGFTTLNIDHKVGGVGDTSEMTLTKYRIFPETTEFRFIIQPVNPLEIEFVK